MQLRRLPAAIRANLRFVHVALSTKRALIVLAVASLLTGVAQFPALGRMSDRGTDVLSMEMVWSSKSARIMNQEWGATGRSAARQHLAIDYLYLISYGLLLYGACVAVARRFERQGRDEEARIGRRIAPLGLAAAGFDAIENTGLLIIIGGHTGSPLPKVVTIAAVLKFALSASTGIYALIGWLQTRGPVSGATVPS